MNERKEYLRIIKQAQLENRKKKNETYYELHHILPKSIFPLWIKRKSNLVLLTAREHLLCHKLLAKIYGGTMWFAYNRLATDKKDGHEVTSEEYEELKIEFAKQTSILMKSLDIANKSWCIGNWNKGKLKSKEYRQKIRDGINKTIKIGFILKKDLIN